MSSRPLSQTCPLGICYVHWLRAWRALLVAAETGARRDIERAFEKLVAALEEEGWLPQNVSHTPRFDPPRSEPPRSNITARWRAEPLWRRIQRPLTPMAANCTEGPILLQKSVDVCRGP